MFNDLKQKQRSPVITSDLETARKITESLEKSGIRVLQSNPSLLLTLNSNVTRLVLSEPNLPTLTCIGFFNFRLISSLLNSVVLDGFYERPIESLDFALVDCGFKEEKLEFLEKFFDLMCRVYAD